jgi:hypothetical protein
LQRNPGKRIALSRAGFNRVDMVAAEGADINVRCVGSPNPLAAALLTPHLAGQGSIKDIDVELSTAIHLKDAACGAPPEQCQIQLRSIEVVLDAVETPAYVGKTEVPDQAVSDTVALESGQGAILGRNRPSEPLTIQQIEFAVPFLLGLPDDAIAPGAPVPRFDARPQGA